MQYMHAWDGWVQSESHSQTIFRHNFSHVAKNGLETRLEITGLDYWTHPNCKIQLVQCRTEAKCTYSPVTLLKLLPTARGVGNEQFWRTRFPDFSLISPWSPSNMTSYVVKVGGAGGLGWFPSLIPRKSALISHDFKLISTDFSTRCTRFLSLLTPRYSIFPEVKGHVHIKF